MPYLNLKIGEKVHVTVTGVIEDNLSADEGGQFLKLRHGTDGVELLSTVFVDDDSVDVAFDERPEQTPAQRKQGKARPGEPLSPAEVQILRLIADGLTARKIAARFDVHATTIRCHAERIRTKLGARNAPHAVRLGHKAGYLGGDAR